jgi:hypothetical protein
VHCTLRRFNSDLEPDPGVVLGGGSGAFIGRVDNNEEVGIPYGLVKIRDGLYAIGGASGLVHLIKWDKARLQFTIVRRIGALPSCYGLALSRQGDIWFNSGLWRWNDPPDAPQPQNQGIPGAIMGQAVMLPNDHFIAPTLRGNVPWVLGGDFTWHVVFDQLQETEPKTGFINGAAVYQDDKRATLLLALDKSGHSRSYQIDVSNGRAFAIRGEVTLETAGPVKEWTSLAMKDADTLLGAGDGFVIEMARDGTNWKETRRWNTVPDGALGGQIYLTADAGRLWISDTENHRILCFNLTDGTFIAAFGRKGEPGNDPAHLDSPRVIEARDNRAVVFDSGNQRLVKFELAQ